MIHPACDFIKFNLDQLFSSYPKSDIKTIDYYVEEAIVDTIFDANVKYKGKKEFNDWNSLKSYIEIDSTLETVFLYRLERLIFLHQSDSAVLQYLASMMKRRTGAEIYYSTQIGKGFNIQHGFGIVVGPRYSIGENFTIHQGVTLGQKNLNSPDEKIVIGNNVTIFANAVVLGNINIGNNVRIGANSVLLHDAIDNGVYIGAPAKKRN